MQLLESLPVRVLVKKNVETSQSRLVELRDISHHILAQNMAVFMESPGIALGKTGDLLR